MTIKILAIHTHHKCSTIHIRKFNVGNKTNIHFNDNNSNDT